MEPEQLQLGFLKVLSGSIWRRRRRTTAFDSETRSLRGAGHQMAVLRGTDPAEGRGGDGGIYYNSGQFRNTVKELQKEFLSPFDMYESLREYYREEGLSAVSHSRNARYEILFAFIEKTLGKRPQTGVQTSAQTEGQTEEQAEDRTEEPADRLELYRDLLTEDLTFAKTPRAAPPLREICLPSRRK